ncbi:MAG: hypothetical protein H6811_10750 [Phycisphaeraceae bacterium]|nr:hypothetical protein [Phycisphaeraceae bacterium]
MSSVAGVGFQLAALPIGVERGWVRRDAAEARARQIVRTLSTVRDNRRDGLFFHFLELESGFPVREPQWCIVSTVDSSILFAGLLTVASYFGGDLGHQAETLVSDADWTRFQDPAAGEGHAGALSLGWAPFNPKLSLSEGELLPYHWLDALCEQRLTLLMALSVPDPAKRPPAALYFRLRRPIGRDRPDQPFVYNAFSGALFTHLLSHMWVDWSSVGPEDPRSFEWPRLAVDWWENSRRAVEMQRRRCAENRVRLPNLGPDAWGLSASDTPLGYQTLGLSPIPVPLPGALVGRDVPPEVPSDRWGDGTLSPHAAAASILFAPYASIRAMRHYLQLSDETGRPLVWTEPREGGYGFFDAFNVEGPDGAPWASGGQIAIDEGMLLLGIENARSGLIWRLFHAHRFVRGAAARLGWPEALSRQESLRSAGI